MTTPIKPPCLVRPLRRFVVWCLLLALPLLGLSATLVELLGPRHVHHEVVEVSSALMDGWSDFRRGAAIRDAAPPHHHHHADGGAERHHHESADTSVLALDNSGDVFGSESATGGSGLGALGIVLAAPRRGIELPSVVIATMRWPRLGPIVFETAITSLLERPPRA